MPRPVRLAGLLCLAGLVGPAGCGDEATGPRPDAAAIDGAAIDATADGATGADAATTDGAAGDSATAPDATAPDAAVLDAAVLDAAAPDAAVAIDAAPDAASIDAASIDAASIDAAAPDAAVAIDAMADAVGGVITGGPCLSGAAGATAYRIRWTGSGGTAQVVYEVNGLPDQSRDHAGAFGYQIGFVPPFVDTALAQGGLRLDGSDFVDLELSTVGVAQLTTATLAIYGRSYNTTASGSFHWQTFDGVGAAPTNLVSNVAPYAWYRADMTTELSPGDATVLIRIKAGPSSGSLAVNRIELCVQAN